MESDEIVTIRGGKLSDVRVLICRETDNALGSRLPSSERRNTGETESFCHFVLLSIVG